MLSQAPCNLTVFVLWGQRSDLHGSRRATVSDGGERHTSDCCRVSLYHLTDIKRKADYLLLEFRSQIKSVEYPPCRVPVRASFPNPMTHLENHRVHEKWRRTHTRRHLARGAEADGSPHRTRHAPCSCQNRNSVSQVRTVSDSNPEKIK